MPRSKRRAIFALLGISWAAGTAYGLAQLWRYGSTPGRAARPPVTWPAESDVPRSAELPTLVMLLHPHCPCSRATLAELARLMADCDRRLVATVLVTRPAGTPNGWERTDLWNT